MIIAITPHELNRSNTHSQQLLLPTFMAQSAGSYCILPCFPDNFKSAPSSQESHEAGNTASRSGNNPTRPTQNPFGILDNDCTIEILRHLSRRDIINLSAVDGLLALKIREAHRSVFPKSRTPAARKSYLRSVTRHAIRGRTVESTEPHRQNFTPRLHDDRPDLFSGGSKSCRVPAGRSRRFIFSGTQLLSPARLPELFFNTPKHVANSPPSGHFSGHTRVYTAEDRFHAQHKQIAVMILAGRRISWFTPHVRSPWPNPLVMSHHRHVLMADIAVPAAEPRTDFRVTKKKRLTADGEKNICAQIMRNRGLLKDRHARKPRVQDEEIGWVQPYDGDHEQDEILWIESEDRCLGLDAAG